MEWQRQGIKRQNYRIFWGFGEKDGVGGSTMQVFECFNPISERYLS